MRLIHSGDLNLYRLARVKAPFKPGEVIFSKALASRMDIHPSDVRLPFYLVE